ncbi:MAG: xylose isomerase-like barrel protein [Paenibacillus sp.]|nr:xylose isomerase-like barrel protein [Paenibacillus sp.]
MRLWSDEDDAVREQALVQAEKEMELLAELGSVAVAAPPFGQVEHVSLETMAANFARLADLASCIGIKPYLEFWGRAKKLSRLGEAVYVAMESGVTDAQLLLDPFHMYTGGSSVDGLAYLNGERIGIVHANDYPAVPTRDTIADRDRVFPGEGVAPSAQLAQLLFSSGYRGYLSLELFIPQFGAMSALDVAKAGLASLADTYRIDDG